MTAKTAVGDRAIEEISGPGGPVPGFQAEGRR